jgi:pimeloyl-ACP methyl ester carboxylesterase
MALVVTLAILALATRIGVLVLERAFPPQGRPVTVDGAVLNVVDLGPREAATPPLLLLHGASSNLAAMRQPLGDLLAVKHRVILIDRPGHGHSGRERETDSTPAIQARMIGEALDKLRIGPVIVVAHSWAGALATRMALDHPSRIAGLVLLAPVAYPWRGGVGWYNKVAAMPVIGPLLACTITLPLGLFMAGSGARRVFLPQAMPPDFVRSTGTPLLLRPREFLANARDLVTLKAAVAEQAPCYGKIRMAVTIISGEVDKTVSTPIHSRPLAAAVAGAKLIVLPGMGHMIQNAVPDLVVSEIEAISGRIETSSAVAAK